MVFQLLFGLNNEYSIGDFRVLVSKLVEVVLGMLKACVPSLMVVRRRHSPLTTHAIWQFSDPAHAIWWVPEALPLL